MLSTWHSNEFRTNTAIDRVWSGAHFHILKREHFYHVGSSEDLRHPMVEALVSNFPMSEPAARALPPAEELTAVVLAGGLGTRLRAAVGDLPKPLAPVRGRPFLDWIIAYLKREGITRAVVSTGYRAELFEEHFSKPRTDGITVICARETAPAHSAPRGG